MKKQLLSTLTLIYLNTNFSFAQTQKGIDINENSGVERMENKGILDDVVIRKYRTNSTIKSSETVIVKNSLQFNGSNIFIKSTNKCNRNMLTSFISLDDAVNLTGGIAGDKPATYTIEPIIDDSSYSGKIVVKFENVSTCDKDGGTENQFNFSLKKLNNTEYEIRNNGNVQREYEIVWQEIK